MCQYINKLIKIQMQMNIQILHWYIQPIIITYLINLLRYINNTQYKLLKHKSYMSIFHIHATNI